MGLDSLKGFWLWNHSRDAISIRERDLATLLERLQPSRASRSFFEIERASI
jgi:hypothetical protein